MNSSRDAAYYSGYTPIRNFLRKFSPTSVLVRSIEYLVEPVKEPLDQVRKQPWTVLLLVKWAFVDEQAPLRGRPAISRPALMKALQKAHELQDRTRMPSEYEHVSLFMRTIAFQQFHYQHLPNSRGLARQELLFADVPEGHWFPTRFRQETGVSVGDFNRLAFCLLAAFLGRRRSISSHWMSTLYRTYTQDVTDRFLRVLSVKADALHELLKAGDKTGRKPSEYFEQTPFLNHPLVDVAGTFWCTYYEILVRSVEHFVYDTLKRIDHNRFNAGFGERFERYVGQVLSLAGIPMATEQELSRALPSGGLVDFLLVDGETTLLVDAKGVEMAARGKIAHLRDVVLGATTTSLMKAIRQAHEVLARLPTEVDVHPAIVRRPSRFLLVVTYKELYIGNGKTLADAVGHEAIDAILANYDPDLRIPLERMYFLTINELELLVSAIKAGKFTISQCLEQAMRDDENPMTRKFVFSLHLAAQNAGGSPMVPPLQAAHDRLTGDVERALGA